MGAAQIDGMHGTADEIALDAGFTLVAQSEMLAHDAARAVAADEVASGRGHGAFGPLCRCGDMRAVIGDSGDGVPVAQHDAGQRGGVAVQHAFDIHLRDAVRQLGRTP